MFLFSPAWKSFSCRRFFLFWPTSKSRVVGDFLEYMTLYILLLYAIMDKIFDYFVHYLYMLDSLEGDSLLPLAISLFCCKEVLSFYRWLS